MTHPARLLQFDQLYSNLQKAHEERLVKKHVAPNGLESYCYSEVCTYEKKWDSTTLMARGLILEPVNKKVVATPFPKFFNVGENSESLPNLAFETFEKMDGSLIIIYHYDGEWQCATKGSLSSDQAKWAKKYIDQYDLYILDKRTTYLAEAIYPENRIVVHYPIQGLFLLGAYDEYGEELEYEQLVRVGSYLTWPVVQRHSYANISELLAQCATLPGDREGFVIRFENGHRVKIKGDEYCRIHRLVSRVTPLAIWEMMEKGDNLEDIRKQLPEEFWTDFDNIYKILDFKIKELIDAVSAWASLWKQKSDKEVGLALNVFPEPVRSFIFPYRKNNGDILSGKSRLMLYRNIRPTGNRLDGYSPSSAMNRVQEET